MTIKAIKAITLWQPWATLVVHGLKQYETRSWSTKHRGLLAIHAAKRPLKQSELAHYAKLLRECNYYPPFWLPYACIIGIVEIETVFKTEEIRGQLSERELQLGNYTAGRYAWRLINPRRLFISISRRGHQGIWTANVHERYLYRSVSTKGALL